MSEPQIRILVADDEPQITKVLRASLTSQGYEVRVANDGEAALDLFRAWAPNMVITDLSMPNMDGLLLCRRVREASNVPILVLSVRAQEQEKVAALDAGADDYVTKPFGIDELLARVRAGLRRAGSQPSAGTRIDVGDFHVDLDSRQIKVGDREVHLTPKEFELLLHLARNPGKVLTHRSILTAVWGKAYAEQSESLRVFVGQLRKKIEPTPGAPRYLLTEPWVGYRFEPGD